MENSVVKHKESILSFVRTVKYVNIDSMLTNLLKNLFIMLSNFPLKSCLLSNHYPIKLSYLFLYCIEGKTINTLFAYCKQHCIILSTSSLQFFFIFMIIDDIDYMHNL